jgi:hypothetical protein
VITALDNQFRIITTSLLGYGGTAGRRTANDFSIERNAEIANGTASDVFRRDASVFVSSPVCMMHARCGRTFSHLYPIWGSPVVNKGG